MTAHALAEGPGRVPELQVWNDYLTKPVKKETLAAHWKNGRILRRGTLRDLVSGVRKREGGVRNEQNTLC